MARDPKLKLTATEFGNLFQQPHWAEKFPPILSLAQTAELLQVPLQTVYQWRSRGLLDRCSQRVGKHVRVLRDSLIRQVFEEGLLDGQTR